MTDFDIRAIVPSSRDLLQVLATRRKSLALVALLGPEAAGEEAARVYELNISAFAFLEPGEAMRLAAQATKTVPMLCLAPAAEKDAFLAARFHGADGVSVPIEGGTPLDEWDRLAKTARTMRMLPLALATDAAAVEAAIKAGARALLLRGATAAAVLDLAAPAPKTMTLVGHALDADMAALRTLAGKVDAAVVGPAVHRDRGFAAFVSDVDP
jgi:DNA-binding NarL/FixJ family response regulator